jgi:hypothetical protein
MSVGGSSVLLAGSNYSKEIDGIISINPFMNPYGLFFHAINSTVKIILKKRFIKEALDH